MIERGTRAVTKVVRLLTDPVPQLVSMVEHGANQTPFLVVKSAEGDQDMAKRSDKGTVAKSAERTADLHKIVFSGADFATEAAVRSYLDTNAYKGAKIEKDGETFVVKGLDADLFEGDIKPIEARKGIVMHAGTLKADADVAAETVGKGTPPSHTITMKEAGTPAELTQKWCSWMAEYSDANTLAAALEAGNDGLPPGMWEINYAFYAALKNVLGDQDVTDKPAKVNALCAEYATYINALQAVLESAMSVKSTVSKAALLGAFQREPVAKAENVNIRVTFNDSSTQDNDERASGPTTAAVLPAASGGVTGPGELNNTETQTASVGAGIPTNGTASDGPKEIAAKTADGSVQPVAATAVAPEGTEKNAGDTTEGAAAPSATTAADAASPAANNDLAAALKAALEPFAAGLTNLSEAFKTQASEQKAALEAVTATVTKTAERVDAVEHRSTSRKSAEETGATGSTEQAPTQKTADTHTTVLRGNLLGRRRRI